MSFGGYKFSGFRVDYDSNQTYIQRTLTIHRARVKAFMSASAQAQSPWVYDPDRMDGTVSLDGMSGVIHELKDSTNTTVGYATFFKHPSGHVGYYMILTSDNCYMNTTSGIQLDAEQICTYDSSYYSPVNASCFHVISPVPFGALPQNSAISIDFLPSEATRLVSIGLNGLKSSAPTNLGGTSTTFVRSTLSNIFGYAIRDTDIITFCRPDQRFSQSAKDQYITILSLNAFSELYNLNDTNGVLLFQPIGGYANSGTSGETSTSMYICNGDQGQVFGRLGEGKTMRTLMKNYARIFPDIRANFEGIGNSVIPLEGAVIGVDGTDVFENGQYAKGCVNPELMALNITFGTLSNTLFDLYTTGLMYVGSYTFGSNANTPILKSNGNSTTPSSYAGKGHINLFIGWDENNPDLRTEAAWPVYTDHV